MAGATIQARRDAAILPRCRVCRREMTDCDRSGALPRWTRPECGCRNVLYVRDGQRLAEPHPASAARRRPRWV